MPLPLWSLSSRLWHVPDKGRLEVSSGSWHGGGIDHIHGARAMWWRWCCRWAVRGHLWDMDFICQEYRRWQTAMTLTQYNMSVQPSIEMHWKTVSIAKKKLSKLVMPQLGPSHASRHTVPLRVQSRPSPVNEHGAGSSSARISTDQGWVTVKNSFKPEKLAKYQ